MSLKVTPVVIRGKLPNLNIGGTINEVTTVGSITNPVTVDTIQNEVTIEQTDNTKLNATVTGNVNVDNFPAVQPVTIQNFPIPLNTTIDPLDTIKTQTFYMRNQTEIYTMHMRFGNFSNNTFTYTPSNFIGTAFDAMPNNLGVGGTSVSMSSVADIAGLRGQPMIIEGYDSTGIKAQEFLTFDPIDSSTKVTTIKSNWCQITRFEKGSRFGIGQPIHLYASQFNGPVPAETLMYIGAPNDRIAKGFYNTIRIPPLKKIALHQITIQKIVGSNTHHLFHLMYMVATPNPLLNNNQGILLKTYANENAGTIMIDDLNGYVLPTFGDLAYFYILGEGTANEGNGIVDVQIKYSLLDSI